jgi:hypothetical protein
MPTNSEIEFEIRGIYQSFSASVGIDDEFNNNEGGVEFSLIGDGKEFWKSKILKRADGTVPVNVRIDGVQRLILKVKRPEGESGRAPADWVNVKLVKNDKP